MEQTIGEILGDALLKQEGQRYQIKSLLGKQRGRRTFLAENVKTKTQVVLKLILFGPDFTWEDLKLFEREAETLKSLGHAAIPKYLDSFEVETVLGQGFVLVQTYIEAKSLQEWVTAGRRFSESDLKELAQSILVILQYLHSRHPAVVHRDIKPSNILLTDRTAHSIGKVYLVDFGSVQVAHHGGTITVVGTYGYMPPEQFGGRASQKSDLYSLGATLIYLATGQHPADFTEDNLEEVAAAHLNVSSHFAKWIRQLVVSNAAQRSPSAAIAFHNLSSTQPMQNGNIYRPDERAIKENALQAVTSPTISSKEFSNFVSVAENAFQVELTAQTFTVRFDQNRIKERLEYLGPQTKVTDTSRARVTFSVALGIVFVWTLLIAAASASTFGMAVLFSAFFVIIATMWAISAESDRTENDRTAVMTLKKLPDESVSLTVEVLRVLTGNDSSHRKVVRSPTQFTNMPLQTVQIQPDSFGFHAKFSFSSNRDDWKPSIRVLGNRRRLGSLLRYINQWDSSIVSSAREPFINKISD